MNIDIVPSTACFHFFLNITPNEIQIIIINASLVKQMRAVSRNCTHRTNKKITKSSDAWASVLSISTTTNAHICSLTFWLSLTISIQKQHHHHHHRNTSLGNLEMRFRAVIALLTKIECNSKANYGTTGCIMWSVSKWVEEEQENGDLMKDILSEKSGLKFCLHRKYSLNCCQPLSGRHMCHKQTGRFGKLFQFFIKP